VNDKIKEIIDEINRTTWGVDKSVIEVIIAEVKEIEQRIDTLEKQFNGLSKRIDALEAKMKFTFVPEPQTTTETATTFTNRTDAIEDFLQNFPNANAGQVYRIIW